MNGYIRKEDATLRIFKVAVVTGIMVMMILCNVSMVYAQDEESFIRVKELSKRDALILSVIYPGLGQMTRGEKMKGISFFAAETISLVLAINANESYSTKERVYSSDMEDYKRIATKGSGTYSEARSMYKDLENTCNDLDDLNTIRNTAIIVAGVVYAYNIFDAIVFGSSDGTQSAHAESDRVHVQSAFIDHTPGILLSKSF